MANVHDLAREYYSTPAEPENTAYRRELLKRIHGAGFKLTTLGGVNYLVDGQDNRKKWRVS